MRAGCETHCGKTGLRAPVRNSGSTKRKRREHQSLTVHGRRDERRDVVGEEIPADGGRNRSFSGPSIQCERAAAARGRAAAGSCALTSRPASRECRARQDRTGAADDEVQRRHLAHHHGAVARFAGANADIVASGDHVAHRVVEVQLEFDARDRAG